MCFGLAQKIASKKSLTIDNGTLLAIHRNPIFHSAIVNIVS